MKRLVSLLIVACISVAAFAQQNAGSGRNEKSQNRDNWDRMKAEKIAFITDFVGLTPEESQNFWPVYNQIEAQQNALVKAEYSAYRELRNAQKTGEGDIASLLDKYLCAKAANINLHVANVEKYKEVLPVEKVAKFFTSEEKYRRELISRLGTGNRSNAYGNKPEGMPSQSRPAGNRRPGSGQEPQK